VSPNGASDTSTLDLLASALGYPTASHPDDVGALRARVSTPATLAAALERFSRFVEPNDPTGLEEIYTRTFDVCAPCCMDVGYQLFGENYTRGAFLVRMKQETRAHGVDPGSELPDHLPVALRLLGRLREDEDPAGLVRDVLLPALDKMVASLRGNDTPYGALLDGIADWLAAAHAIDRASVAPPLLPRAHLPVFGQGAAP
jgi:nitrate reductase delta subunit